MISKLFKAVQSRLIKGFTYHPNKSGKIELSIGGQNKRTKRRASVSWCHDPEDPQQMDDWELYQNQQVAIMLTQLGEAMEQRDLVEKLRAL